MAHTDGNRVAEDLVFCHINLPLYNIVCDLCIYAPCFLIYIYIYIYIYMVGSAPQVDPCVSTFFYLAIHDMVLVQQPSG